MLFEQLVRCAIGAVEFFIGAFLLLMFVFGLGLLAGHYIVAGLVIVGVVVWFATAAAKNRTK
jgi:hypothetical protein